MYRGAFIVLAIARAKVQKERWEQLMAQFEELNSSIDALSESVDSLVSRLEDATVEDPAVQQQIDEAVARIKEVQGRVDGIAAGSGGDNPVVDNTLPDTEPRPDQTLPGDLPKGG